MVLASQKCIQEQDSELPMSLKFGLHVSECEWKWKIGVSHFVKWEKWLSIAPKMHIRVKLPITDFHKSGSSVFQVSTEIGVSHY